MLQVVHGVITRHLLGQAGLKPDEADSGAVTLIQRFGSAANLNVHLHCLVLDGVYRRGTDGTPEFVEAPAPTDAALQTVQGAMPRETDFKQTLCADMQGFRAVAHANPAMERRHCGLLADQHPQRRHQRLAHADHLGRQPDELCRSFWRVGCRGPVPLGRHGLSGPGLQQQRHLQDERQPLVHYSAVISTFTHWLHD